MKYFLIFILIWFNSETAYSQTSIMDRKKDSIVQLLFNKNKISFSDTIYSRGFIKNINVSLLSTIDTCNKVELYLVSLPKAHSDRFYFISDTSGMTFLDFADVADLLIRIGKRLSNNCSVSQKEKILIAEYLLDGQKQRGMNYRNR